MFSAKDIFQTKAKAGGYTIAKSLRFRSSASAYLSRTPGSAGNQQKFTQSFWLKRGKLGANQWAGVVCSGSAAYGFYFDTSDILNVYIYYTGSVWQGQLVTTQVFRDPSAWYHFVLAVDTTQATNTDRIKLFINGVLVPSSGFSTANYPNQNQNTNFNSAIAHNINQSSSANYGDCYLAEFYWLDGYAPATTTATINGTSQTILSDFGQFDTATGVWMPKAYTGTYGTNGFYLKFTDVGSTSGSNAGYGKDFAGTNYWTTNNLSSTAGVTYDSMYDTPTNYDNGVTGAGNYATLNPLTKVGGSAYTTLSQGNLQTTTGNNVATSTIPIPPTGKWYMEFDLTTAVYPQFALGNTSFSGAGTNANGFGFYMTSLFAVGGGSGSITGSWASGDICLVAVDATNSKLWLGRKSGGTVAWFGGGDPATGTSPTFSASGGGGVISTTYDVNTYCWPCCASGGGGDIWSANFGQRGFSNTVPTGFKALNTFNLPTPTIGATSSTLANSYFDISLWTGSGSNQNITNTAGFQPDFVWGKIRSGADLHVLANSVAGATKYLVSNSTQNEVTDATTIASFNSNGFTVGTSTNLNRSTYTFVGWQWKANGSGTLNQQGSINSTVSANVTAGFSVVTYTGTSTTGTVGHGLGVAPKMIIVKTRNAVADWYVYHASNGANKYMYMNLTNAVISNAGYFDTVSSTVFGGTSAAGIISTSNFVAYCFAEVAGYSKFGSYTGNGSADGPFIYFGFRPRYLLVKRTDTTSDWIIMDTARDPSNVTDKAIFAELSNAEGTGWTLDFLSNGFKLRFTGANLNASGGTYIYAAFCETPFAVNNRAR